MLGHFSSLLLNDGDRTLIIEDVAIEISKANEVARFKGVMTVDLQQLQQEGINPTMLKFDWIFTEQAVSPGETLKLDLLFVPWSEGESRPMPAVADTYECKLYTLLADREEPILLRKRIWDLTHDLAQMFSAWNGEAFPTIRFRQRPIF